jgi:hypothetical protein
LSYESLPREIVLEASMQFNILEERLARAIHDAPSILDRFTYGKERYIDFFHAAFLKRVQKDNAASGALVYDNNTWDPGVCDLVIHVDIKSDVAANQRLVDDLTLSAQVEAALVKEFPQVTANAKNGEVFASLRASLVEEHAVTEKVKIIAEEVEEVKVAYVNVVPFVIEG